MFSGSVAAHAEPAPPPTHGDTPPSPEADPFIAPACEGSEPDEASRVVTGEQLENYNSGGIAVLYGSQGTRDEDSATAPGCGVRYVEAAGGPVSEWMYCTDMAKAACLNVMPDGSLVSKEGHQPVDPMEWLDGNDKLTADQSKVIAYILQNDMPVTPPPSADVTTTSNRDRHERYARQLMVWCVSDYDRFGVGGENNLWCNENIGPERQAEILTLIPETPQVNLSISGGQTNIPVGATARLVVSTNVFKLPIDFEIDGAEVKICSGDATLTDHQLVVQGTNPETSKQVHLCVKRTSAGDVTLSLSATPQASKYLSWAQANHSSDTTSCQVFAAFERSRATKVRAMTQLNFVDDLGTFNVRKALSGIEPGDFPEGTTFPVEATWNEGSATIDVPADGTPVSSGVILPAGTVVTLAEGTPPEAPEGYTFTSSHLSDESITILADDNPDIELIVTNTYERVLGGFDLSKTLKGVSSQDFPKETQFTVTALLTIDGKEVTREFTLPADGSLVEGPRDLPVGTTVTLKEVKIPTLEGYVFTGVDFSEDAFTITANEPLHITATNTYSDTPLTNEGTFNVRKALSGIEPGDFPEGTTFPVEATWNEGSATIDVPADGTPVSSGVILPAGTVVTLAEGTPPEAPEGYTFTSSHLSDESITILADDNPDIELIVTNTYERVLGGFDLNKTLKGVSSQDFPKETQFTVTALLTIDGKEVTREFTLPADGSLVEGPRDLPVGTTVTLKEVKIPTLEGYVFTGVDFSEDAFTITANEPLHITATNTYQKSPLAVTGSEMSPAMWLVPGLLVLFGGAILWLTRRQRRE
ncbi:DUF5979 domain-containing protein [Leucobacter chinensis]|uniref:DUF5979 domain-containing protein n=1 Tax=Leucobacter chinensis TaxID=2851010 RepID=UPI001C22677C|nr:DUF5979 domain-containing protein [Leucobacter chinensis]